MINHEVTHCKYFLHAQEEKQGCIYLGIIMCRRISPEEILLSLAQGLQCLCFVLSSRLFLDHDYIIWIFKLATAGCRLSLALFGTIVFGIIVIIFGIAIVGVGLCLGGTL